MALQGDLRSFALPDVLRLLGSSGKSGALEVTTPSGTGEVWFHEGGIVGGAIAGADHVVAPGDVLFELLRHDNGSFVFDDEELIEEAPTAEVEAVLAEAEAMVAEWAEVEAVVPSMDAWVTLAADIDGDVTITAASWGAVAAIGSGGSVHDLAESLALTDLAASRAVKGLVEQGLVEVRSLPVHGQAPAAVDVAPEPYGADPVVDLPDLDVDPGMPVLEDLDVLGADERAVVMEVSDDALLPEPLPGEGYSYADETEHYATVDGPSFDAQGSTSAAYEPIDAAGSAFPIFDRDDITPVGDPIGSFPDHDAPRPDFLGEAEPVDEGADHGEDVAHHGPVDGDRGSLLKFLSTVKP